MNIISTIKSPMQMLQYLVPIKKNSLFYVRVCVSVCGVCLCVCVSLSLCFCVCMYVCVCVKCIPNRQIFLRFRLSMKKWVVFPSCITIYDKPVKEEEYSVCLFLFQSACWWSDNGSIIIILQSQFGEHP